jgi:hypothetical protein
MAGLFGTCPEQRAVSEYNSRSQSQETRMERRAYAVGLAVADHLAVADRFCKQEDKKARVNEVDTWQVGLNSSAQATSSGLFC